MNNSENSSEEDLNQVLGDKHTNSETEMINHIRRQVYNKIAKEKGGKELYDKNNELKNKNAELKDKIKKIKMHEDLKEKNRQIQRQIEELTEKERIHKEKTDKYHERYEL